MYNIAIGYEAGLLTKSDKEEYDMDVKKEVPQDSYGNCDNDSYLILSASTIDED